MDILKETSEKCCCLRNDNLGGIIQLRMPDCVIHGDRAKLRDISYNDVVKASDESYDLGRKHGKEEMFDDIERAKEIALRKGDSEEVIEAFKRININL